MRAGWLLLVLLGACVKAGDVPCGDRVCPSDTVCESVTHTCITQEQDTVCSEGQGIPDGEACSGFGFVGICQNHKCLPGCGDGSLNTALETCDDANFRSHDGCSSSCLAETLSWEQMADTWTGMFDHVAAYHPAGSPYNGFLVVLTGQSQAALRTQQHVARGDATSFILENNNPVLPSPRKGAAMAYSAARNKLVLFGGRNADYLDDTWEWDVATGWTQVVLVNRPPPREGGEVAYDTVSQRMVLFGGFNSSGYLHDTWEYNGTWVETTTATFPSGRTRHAMAYDQSRDRVVLYGGNVLISTTLSDHWEYDNGVWTLVAPVGVPGKRSGAAMGYTADRKIVMFGGFTEGPGGPAFANDTWQYNNSSWTQVASTSSPPARGSATLTPAASPGAVPPYELILIGGEQSDGKPTLADVWRLTPSGWAEISAARLPPARQGAPAVYDDLTHGINVFGGIGTAVRKDVWSFVESGWNPRAPETFIPHYLHAAAYDPTRKRIVMFGGLDATTPITNDTFETDPSPNAPNAFKWYPVVPTQSPSPRIGGVLAWTGTTLVLFGGNVSGTLTDETWTYNGVTWSQDTKTAPWPKATAQAAAAYDQIHERLVLFDRDGVTWTYANHAWTKLVEASGDTPPARDDASMTYDWQTRRMLLTGGRRVTTDLLSDIWELDNTTWRKLDAFGTSPLPRALFGLSSTPLGQQTLLVGGTATGGQPSGDVWTLRYEAAGTDDENCRNSVDDDGDLRVDRADPDCCHETNSCLDGP